MPDEVHVPKVGKMPKPVIISMGVVLVGYLVYHHYTKAATAASTGPTTSDQTTADTSGAGDVTNTAGGPYTYGGYGQSGGYYLNPSSGSVSSFLTNAQWSQQAVSDLVNDGYDAATVATALGLFLGGQGLTSDQQNIVRAAIALEGSPPVGSFSIKSVTSTPVSTPAPTPSPTPITTTPTSGVSSHPIPQPPKSTQNKTLAIHTVVHGETLSGIAREYGRTEQQVWNYNITPGVRPAATIAILKARGQNLLYAGEQIYIPR